MDAETILAKNIKEEAEQQSKVEVPAPTVSEVDVTTDAAIDEFDVIGLDGASGVHVTEDPDDQAATDDNQDDDDDTSVAITENDEEKEVAQ